MDLESAKEIAPGLVGAALASLRGDKQWVERMLGFAVGWCFAIWGTAPLIDFFGLTAKATTYAGGIGFALGYFGMAVADGILSSDWAAIVKARMGLS